MNTQVRTAVFIGIGLVIMGGLYYFLQPQTTQQPTSDNRITQPLASDSAAPLSNAKAFNLTIQGGKIITGSSTITVTEGDEVALNITSDKKDEFHLHGYNQSVVLQPGQPSRLYFIAKTTGRFEFELEESKLEIGALEVHPK